ncbi:gamma carbonic anhydrase family protein [Actinomycetospora flava]|uniref:Gamma carbonic anhydrase family protein n=1 Tax=Actinomycetospora flava TaxID=3129232 RepID=A0ABU8M3P6_9PSEU
MSLITVLGHTPTVAEGAWVAPGAVVAGRVTIGTDTGVWYTAVVRADMESVTVGEGTSVQDGTVVHADPGFPCSIGDNVTVGHRAVVHGCTVEDDCLIGMGAVVMNGATVGRGSVVAAGAVISQGVTIPPGSLVAGVPGKVRREVTDDERAMIAASAATYRYLLGVHRDATA